MQKQNLINEFVTKEVIEALDLFISSSEAQQIKDSAILVSTAFASDASFKSIIDGDDEAKLVSSFKKNLTLLIQKTWIEKSDESIKEQVLYKLEQFCAYIEEHKYADEYNRFGQILSDVVYLMFGSLSKTPEFDEYALRIDPEFGIFWWYIQNLPESVDWSDEKCRAAILLGMYFLANY
ncbi:MAG: hypothetical protein J6B63_03275 [Treponema sp.]|nr:hypothetical protein [Treponema sp.]MBQ7881516.1 hypothetical protein [Treponema sp.]